MGATASLRRPATGATAELPVPDTGEAISPERADAESFQSTAGEVRKGLRSSVNSVTAGALRIAGDIGESLGLTEFAARRFAEAEDYVAFADEVGPAVRDYRAVKDTTDAVNFASGLLGQAAGSILPAVAAGAVGARLGGLRGAVGGAFGSSAVLNAGDQALRVQGEGTAPERLASEAGVGLVSGALDTVVPAAGFRRVAQAARTGAKGAGIAKTVGGAVLGETATETAQEKVGQLGHQAINPNRDDTDDTAQLINAAFGGAVGGLAFGGGTKGAEALAGGYKRAVSKRASVELDPNRGQTPDEVLSALGRTERPIDLEDISGAPDDMDQVPEWLEQRENASTKNIGEWFEKVKNQPWAKKFTDITDPAQATEFYEELKGKIKDTVDVPRTRGLVDKFKGFVQKLGKGEQKEGKQSLQRTPLDLAIFDNMLKHMDPKDAEALPPAKKLELAENLKTYMLASFRQRDPVEGPGAPQDVRGFERQAMSVDPTKDLDKRITHLDAKRAEGKTRIEGERQTVPAQVPHELMDLFGDKLEPLFASTDALLRTGGQAMRKVDYKKGLDVAHGARAGYQTQLEETVRGSLRPEFLENEGQTRDTAVREVARWMQKQIVDGPDNGDWQEFDRKVQTFFGPRADDVIEAFDAEREGITRGYENFGEDEQAPTGMSTEAVAARLAQNEQFNVTREDQSATEEAQADPEDDVAEDSVYRDKRLNVAYEELTEAKHIMAGLRNDYRERDVKFRVEPVVQDGKLTGKVTIHAEDAQASPEYTEGQWDSIRDKLGKSGTQYGVLTVTRKTDKTDKKPWKVSIPNLTAETMRSIGRAGGGPDFVHDMVLRGLSNLMTDPKFTGFSKMTKGQVVGENEHLVIPDDAVVAHHDGRNWTWGELMNRGREETRTKDRQYWQGVVEHLNRLMVEYKARKKANPEYEDSDLEQYVELRAAVEAGDPGAKQAYNEFVREWAQTREEFASGFQADEREPEKGMVGINSIEDAFYRDRRLEAIAANIKDKQGRIKNNMVERPEGFQDSNRSLASSVRRLKREETRLREGLSSTLRENEIEQTSRRGTEPEPRFVQEETRVPLVGPAGPARMEPGEKGGPVTESTEKLTAKEKKRVKAGKGAFADSTDEKKAAARPEKPRDTGKFSEMRVGGEPMSEEDKAAVRAHVEKVLGPKAKTLFEAALPDDAAGMFKKVGPEEQVLISLRALDPRAVGFHETLHALMERLGEDNPRVASTLLSAASSPKIVAQLRKLLAGEPRALEQLQDPEERLAYMYQFWAAGKLEMGPKAGGVFKTLQNFLGRMLSAWTELSADTAALPQAEKILQAFHNGELAERSAAGRALDRVAPPPSDHFVAKWGDLASKVFFTADGYIRGFKIPAMTEVANKMLSPSEQQGAQSGMMQTKHIVRNKLMNKYVDSVQGLDDAALERIRGALSGGKEELAPAERIAATKVRALLKEVFDYMKESGVQVVEWNTTANEYVEHDIKYSADYVPRAYDLEKIKAKMPEFKAMLRKHGFTEVEAEEFAERMVTPSKADPNESDVTTGLVYYAPNTMHRKLNIPDADLRPFMVDNLGAVMYKYINYTVRRAEYAKRFGNQGQEIALAVEKAKAQGATDEQVRSFNQYVQAMEGSLGNEIDPRLRAFFGGVMTYQNLRLLPLAIFSSLVDPLGIMVRGGTLAESFGAFTRGIRELATDKQDEARELAKTVGAVNAATDEQMMADAYGSNFVKGWQRWMNKKLFQLNGMESWNTSMRIAATAAAQEFLIRHATKPGAHSERYLAELGLSKDDVTVLPGGGLDLTPAVVDAMNKWVDGAVLRPHAGVRPIWMSDPKFMLISHLKQFTYSFHKTIVARAAHEVQHGNVSPALAMLSYVPMIIAADMLRGLVTPGGADDDRLEKWDLADWMAHGVVRAGITGPGQYALDVKSGFARGDSPAGSALGGIGAIGGPSVDQLFSMIHAIASPGGHVGREVLRAIPPVPALNIKG